MGNYLRTLVWSSLIVLGVATAVIRVNGPSTQIDEGLVRRLSDLKSQRIWVEKDREYEASFAKIEAMREEIEKERLADMEEFNKLITNRPHISPYRGSSLDLMTKTYENEKKELNAEYQKLLGSLNRCHEGAADIREITLSLLNEVSNSVAHGNFGIPQKSSTTNPPAQASH